MITSWNSWSNTKLEDAIECMYRLFLIYADHVPRTMTVPLAAGLYVHAGCKKFNDPEEKRPHFASAHSYANRRVGTWKRFVAKDKIYGKQNITESFDGEIWAISESVIRPCSEHFYDLFIGRERPVDLERRFRFTIGDFALGGSFDVIDAPLGFMDYKTGKQEPQDAELKADLQFTIYSAALPLLLAHDRKLQSQFHLSEGERKTLKDNPLDLIEAVKGEYVHLRSGKIFETRRTRYDVIELLNTIESVAARAEQGDFAHSRGYRCVHCYVRERCDQDRERGRILTRVDLEKITDAYVLFPSRRELKVYTDIPRNIRVLEDHRFGKHQKQTGDYPLFKDIA